MLNFLPGAITGAVFGIILELSSRDKPAGIGQLFSADLAGAALGSILPPLFMLPLIGTANTFILFCGMNVAAGLYLQTGRKI